MSDIVQLVTAVLVLISTIIGILTAKRTEAIKITVNGRMSELQRRLDEATAKLAAQGGENGDSRPRDARGDSLHVG